MSRKNRGSKRIHRESLKPHNLAHQIDEDDKNCLIKGMSYSSSRDREEWGDY